MRIGISTVALTMTLMRAMLTMTMMIMTATMIVMMKLPPGVDIKQWTNCRVGMLGWAIFSLNFALVSTQVWGGWWWASYVVG